MIIVEAPAVNWGAADELATGRHIPKQTPLKMREVHSRTWTKLMAAAVGASTMPNMMVQCSQRIHSYVELPAVLHARERSTKEGWRERGRKRERERQRESKSLFTRL